MSKSLGNTYTIPDVVARGYRPSAVRYLLLSAHYRKQLNFTWASLGQAEEALRRLTDFLVRLNTVTREDAHAEVAARVEQARKEFSEAMQDDLNTAAALGAMFDLVRALNFAIDAGDLGQGGCGVWEVRPRLGLIGMLAGWWPTIARVRPALRERSRPDSRAWRHWRTRWCGAACTTWCTTIPTRHATARRHPHLRWWSGIPRRVPVAGS